MLMPLYSGSSQGRLVPIPNAKTAPPAEAAVAQSTTPESLGWQLRGALPPMRLHSVTLCDQDGDVLWLSEGALGPDEHGFVIEAIGALSSDLSLAHVEYDLQDGRYGVFLPVRAPQAELVALVMILAETKGLGTGVAPRILTQQVRLILQKIAIYLRPQLAMAAAPPAAIPVVSAPAIHAQTVNPVSAKGAQPPAVAKPAQPAVHLPPQGRAPASPQKPPVDFGSITSVLTPLAVDDILSFELVDEESEYAPMPASSDPALALSPESEELDDRFDLGELALEEESDASPKASVPPPPAVIVPSLDIPVLSAAPVVARAPAIVEPIAKNPEPVAPPAPVLSPTDIAIKALREPSNAYAAMRYGAIPVEKQTPPAAAPAPRPSIPAPKLNSHVDPAFKDLALSVQLLSKLRPGGRTRRYEVLLRNKENPKALIAANEIIRALDEKSDLDGFVISQLLTWLAENPKASEREPLTFSINLSPRALHDERFPEFVASWLRKTGIAAESIGFELSEKDCVEHKPQAERFVAACEKLGCFIVLDDFTMDTRAIDFLRSKALKLIKLDSRLTNEAMKDKLAQAMVIGISQAAKVLGVHCAAKKIESQMVRRWITAIGFDFAQGTLFEGPQHVNDLLLPPPAPKTES